VSSQPKKPDALVWLALFIFIMFLAWVGYYLVVLRPQINQWAFKYVTSYPAMLHLIPLVGGPILVMAAIALPMEYFRKKCATKSQ
jgi:hypothetical protein